MQDESFLLDSPQVPRLGEATHHFASAMSIRYCRSGTSGPLFIFSMAQLKLCFEAAHKKAGFLKVSYVMYQARQGGPSEDRRANVRSALQIKQRDRWASDTSVKRYEAHARIQQQEILESTATLNRAMVASAWLPLLFTEKIAGFHKSADTASSSSRILKRATLLLVCCCPPKTRFLHR